MVDFIALQKVNFSSVLFIFVGGQVFCLQNALPSGPHGENSQGTICQEGVTPKAK